jgi:hypothetical protein
MDLDHRQTALMLARGRAVVGIVLLVLPGLAARATFDKRHRNSALRAVLRLMGIRDLVLGLGAITTLKEQTMDAEWVGMGAIADAVDGMVLFVTPALGVRARLAGVSGAASAAAGLFTARALADARNRSEGDA